jgi:predicted O-linked N-acetylglucosamine transferase (SPINDLY family)
VLSAVSGFAAASLCHEGITGGLQWCSSGSGRNRPRRVRGLSPAQELPELFRRVDICLDTVPYNGHTTTLDSLWMGVPVVTLVGTPWWTAGYSQLKNLICPS